MSIPTGSSIVSPTGLIKTKKRDLTWMEQTNQTCSEKWVDDLTSAQREEAFKNLNSGCLNSHKGDDKSGSCTTFMSRRARKRQNQRNKKKSKANQQHNTQKSTCQAFQGEATTQPCVNISEATGPSTPVMATGVTTTSFVHIETKCKEAALIELLRESRCHASNSLSTAATATASVVSTVQAWTQQVISQPIKSETERRQEEPRQIKVEESETHQLAMSLIPILNQVPRERLVSVHQELMQVIFRNIPAFSGVAGAMQRPPVPLHGQQPYVPLYSHTAHRGPAPFPILHPTNAFISPRISRW
ncbi:uncharacterized protein [Hyperolius riggenbachi]|uniref:uncharacterized protein n=1 Tax=Hyperolius riggenbachi TaxID=752182 RepID=UPI0035A3280A